MVFEKQRRVYIAWFPFSAPSDSMAKHLKANAYHIHYFKRRRLLIAPIKYVCASVKTFFVLYKERPDIIFVQNPPVFAPVVVWLYCCIKKSKYIVDTHSGIFTARRWRFFLPLYKFLARRALMNMLHNEPLAREVKSWNAPSIVLEPSPILKTPDRAFPFRSGFNVLVISSYDPDEPIHEVIEAAKYLPDVNFYITGSLHRAPHNLSKQIPANVMLTDFIPREDFLALLKGCDAATCLTTDDNTHQWGALEALEFERPIITSDWPVLRDYFSKGTIHIDNTATAFVEGIKRVRSNHSHYLKEIKSLKEELHKNWKERFSKLNELLDRA